MTQDSLTLQDFINDYGNSITTKLGDIDTIFDDITTDAADGNETQSYVNGRKLKKFEDVCLQISDVNRSNAYSLNRTQKINVEVQPN